VFGVSEQEIADVLFVAASRHASPLLSGGEFNAALARKPKRSEAKQTPRRRPRYTSSLTSFSLVCLFILLFVFQSINQSINQHHGSYRSNPTDGQLHPPGGS
jgi:hypothetical protein